ncbi:hypothetical protein ACFYUD_31435 [Nocardia tengchongensis]|uniref:hypothetical protein n=1 Tax=Nocardia tengchongensis TaxID=2055889 RepID=UPI0036C2F33C
MPKIIDLKLQQITCTANGFGGAVQLSGDVFGATFQNDPNDPNDLKVKEDIFPFPNGPISISEGQVVPITMKSVRWALSNPNHEPPNLAPKFLKVGGQLNPGLDSAFFVIKWDVELPPFFQTGDVPPPPPRKFNLDYTSENLGITLTFGLSAALG